MYGVLPSILRRPAALDLGSGSTPDVLPEQVLHGGSALQMELTLLEGSALLMELTAVAATELLFLATVTLALAAVHVLTPGLTVLESIPRAPLISFGSGVSVAYVFAHLLPEVERASDAVVRGDAAVFPVELPVYLVALVGFVAFYGLEHYVQQSTVTAKGIDEQGPDSGGGAEPVREFSASESAAYAPGLFWVHIAAFAWYNAILGYLVAERVTHEESTVLLFAVAIGLHMFVNDHGLREHYPDLYHDVGRWILAAAVVLGAVVGVWLPLPALVVGTIVSFLAGAIVLNVVKEELPEHRNNRFPAFAFGVVLFTALSLAM